MAAKKCSLRCLLATWEGTSHVSNGRTGVSKKLKFRYSEFNPSFNLHSALSLMTGSQWTHIKWQANIFSPNFFCVFFFGGGGLVCLFVFPSALFISVITREQLGESPSLEGKLRISLALRAVQISNNQEQLYYCRKSIMPSQIKKLNLRLEMSKSQVHLDRIDEQYLQVGIKVAYMPHPWPSTS